MKTLEDDVDNIKSSGIQASDNTSGDFIASSLRTDVAGECLLYHCTHYIHLECNSNCEVKLSEAKLLYVNVLK